jgi:SAM-dependent methyltransferase
MTAHTSDVRQHSPAAARNRAPILAAMQRTLPRRGVVLEVGSGSGEHAVFLAAAIPGLTWQPSDRDQTARASVAAWSRDAGLSNVRPPLALDVTEAAWEAQVGAPVDAVVCINVLHIAPWAAAEGLLAGVGRLLGPAGVLFVYGPFKRDGRHTAPSNEAFDASLRARDPRWGVREVADVQRIAAPHGLALRDAIAMPANNLALVFVRA